MKARETINSPQKPSALNTKLLQSKLERKESSEGKKKMENVHMRGFSREPYEMNLLCISVLHATAPLSHSMHVPAVLHQ